MPITEQVHMQLLRVEQEGAYAGLVNGSPIDTDSHSDVQTLRDERDVRNLVSNITRWRRKLDYIISSVSGRTASDLDATTRQLLRMGVYELVMCGMASHALNEHVQLAKSQPDGRGASSLVNAILRKTAKQLADATLRLPESDLPEGEGRDASRALAIAHSHPTWLAARWLRRFGRDAAVRLMEHNNRPPTYSVRLTTAAPQDGLGSSGTEQLMQELVEAGAEVERSSYLPQEFLRIRSGLQAVLRGGWLASGRLVVQDESAGLVVALLDPQPGDIILDCCAAPGGKALMAAGRMRGEGTLVAADISEARLRALQGTARRSGLGGVVRVLASDLCQLKAKLAATQAEGEGRVPLPELYSKVLLDAPCSGSGVLAKRADLRWRRQAEDLLRLTALQDELMDAAAELVQPGGLMVYSTCSIEPEENLQRVETFLTRHPRWTVEPPPAGQLHATVLTEAGVLSTLPHEHGVDGAFGARLRKAPA